MENEGQASNNRAPEEEISAEYLQCLSDAARKFEKTENNRLTFSISESGMEDIMTQCNNVKPKGNEREK